MGYILPITNYVYKDYQRRVIKHPDTPYYVGGSSKVSFKGRGEDVNDGKNKKRQDLSNITTLQLKQSTSEKLIAEISGKGTLFSARI